MRRLNSDTLFTKFIVISFGLFPMIPDRAKGIPVIILILISLINYIRNKINSKDIIHKKNVTFFFIMSSTYLLYILSILYTSDASFGIKKLEIGLSLLIVPLSFLLIRKNILESQYLELFKKIFLLGSVSFASIFLVFSFFYENEYYPKGIFIVEFFRKAITEMPLIATHPIYSSVFFGIGLILLFNIFKNIRLVYFIYSLIILLISIALLASKMVIVSLFIVILIFLFMKTKKYRLISLLVVFILFISTLVYIPNINKRFKELAYPQTYEKIDIHNSSSIRYAINQSSTSLIKQSWIFGYGVGDVQNELNKVYKGKSDHLLSKQYNSHNQYISIWLGTGIFGLIAFLFMLGYNFRSAWINKDLLFLSILIFYSLNFLTENLLERQSGVILFAFIINLFGWHNYNKLNQKYE